MWHFRFWFWGNLLPKKTKKQKTLNIKIYCGGIYVSNYYQTTGKCFYLVTEILFSHFPPPPPLLYFVSLLVCVIAVVWKKLYQFFENSSQNGWVLLRKFGSPLWVALRHLPNNFVHLCIFSCFASVPETSSASNLIVILRGVSPSFIALIIYI